MKPAEALKVGKSVVDIGGSIKELAAYRNLNYEQMKLVEDIIAECNAIMTRAEREVYRAPLWRFWP